MIWIGFAVAFIVGSFFGVVTMCFAFTAKNADRQMCKCYEDLSVKKEPNESKCKIVMPTAGVGIED